MTFLAPGFLVGLAAAVVPLIIHLLARWSKRSIDFSSILFLSEIQRSSIAWYSIREKYLLLIRTMLLIIIPLALSRPQCTGNEADARDILVIDRSASMDGSYGAIWNEAMDRARAVIHGNHGDIHSVWTAGEHATLIADQWTVNDNDAFLGTLAPTGEVFDCGSVLTDLRAWALRNGTEHVRIHLISDFQSENWKKGGTDVPGVTIYGIPLKGVTDNIGIESAAIVGLSSLTHGALIAQIEIGNYGREEVVSEVKILWGGETYRFPVTIPPGGSYIEVPLGPPMDDVMKGYVSVEDSSGITMDNRFDFIYSPPDVPGIAIMGGSDEERHRIQSVLIPSASFGSDFHVTMLDNTPIIPSELDTISTAIIFPTPVSKSLHDAIIQHYARGMGIVFICSGNDLPESWCDIMEEVIGASPGDLVIPGITTGETHVVESTLLHPILNVYRGIGGVSLPHVWRVFRWPSSHGRMLLRLPNRMPLLVEKDRGGGGKILVWTTGFLPPMSDWSSRSSFVPLFRRSIVYTSSDIRICTMETGASSEMTVLCPGNRCSFRMEYPDGSKIPLDVRFDRSGGAYLHVMLGYRPGAHVIRRENEIVAVCHAVIDSVERIPGREGFRPSSVRFDLSNGEYFVTDTRSDLGLSTILFLVAGLCLLAEGIVVGMLARRQSQRG